MDLGACRRNKGHCADLPDINCGFQLWPDSAWLSETKGEPLIHFILLSLSHCRFPHLDLIMGASSALSDTQTVFLNDSAKYYEDFLEDLLLSEEITKFSHNRKLTDERKRLTQVALEAPVFQDTGDLTAKQCHDVSYPDGSPLTR